MTNWKRALGLSLALGSGASISSALAQQLNSQQIQMIRDTAASICNTIKEAKGQKSDVQIEGDVKAQLGGLVGKVVDLGGAGKGSLSREEFEGLSRDATAAALEGDRGCRERVFDKMFDKLSMMPPPDKKSSLPKAEKLIAAVDLGYHVQAIYNDLELAEHAAFCGTPGIPERWFAGDSGCTSLENENRKNLLFSNLASENWENWVNWVKLKLYQNALKAEGFDDKAAQVDSDAGRLNIELSNFGSLTIDDDIFAGHIADDLERRIIEQDTLEAYKIGANIFLINQNISRSTYKIVIPAKVLFSEFDVIRNDLTLHLRSLNLAEVDNQIPNRPEQRDWRWLDNFMASLHGLIRKNYPTVSLTQ